MLLITDQNKNQVVDARWKQTPFCWYQNKATAMKLEQNKCHGVKEISAQSFSTPDHFKRIFFHRSFYWTQFRSLPCLVPESVTPHFESMSKFLMSRSTQCLGSVCLWQSFNFGRRGVTDQVFIKNYLTLRISSMLEPKTFLFFTILSPRSPITLPIFWQ